LREVKIFVSSPGDVDAEREIVKQVIIELADDYHFRDICLPRYKEHDEPIQVSKHPQVMIDQTLRQCDIVLLIMWSRMGTELP